MTPKLTFLTLGHYNRSRTPYDIFWCVLVPKAHLMKKQCHLKWYVCMWRKSENWWKMSSHSPLMLWVPPGLHADPWIGCLHRCPHYAHLPEPRRLFEKMIKWYMYQMAIWPMLIYYVTKWPWFRVKGHEKVTYGVTCDQALTCPDQPCISFGWQY